MILRGNHKSSKSNLNAADLEKEMGKEVYQGLVIPLTIDSVRHIKNAVVFLLGVG